MRSFKLFLFLLIYFFSLNAEIEINYHENNIEINGSFHLQKNEIIPRDGLSYSRLNIDQCSNTNIQGYELPVLTRFISLPATGNYKISSSNLEFEEVKLTNNIIPFVVDRILPEVDYDRDEWFPENVVTIGEPAIMRGNRFSQITIAALQYNPAQKSIRLISDIDLEMNINSSDNRNPFNKLVPSGSFSRFVSQKVIGADPDRPEENGQYLIITPQACEEILQPLLRWKEKLGYSTHLAILEEIGSNETDIKDYLQNAYDNWEVPPEYVILVGDVDGSYALPSYFIPGYLFPWCVTDHPYTLLDGDDYFPDVLIGRLSVRSEMQLMTIISKI